MLSLQELSGKKILFIGPKFFGYEQDIANELRIQGAEVDFLPDRPFTSPVMKAVIRFRRDWIIDFSDRYFLESVEAFGRGHYDLIFVVQGEGLSVKTLSIFRMLFPKARLVWYLWDSLRNKKSLVPNLDVFDDCHTFDAKDANYYGINFRPLFFSSGFSREATSDYKYHLSFIGTAHSDRFRIVSNMIAAIPEQTICYWYLYLQAPWVFWAHKISNPAYRGASITKFCFDPMPKQHVQNVFFDSLAILDIEHPRQTGLTMRTFEALGANKKLVTTNSLIKDCDFYNPQNILVIDRDYIPRIPDDFFQSPYIPLTDLIYNKYSLKAWLRDVVANLYCPKVM
jgi:hypothetical protein